MKKVLLILRPGLQESFADIKNIILLLIIGFILDNGVRVMVDHAKQVGQPLGVFETFIMCLNHWYYLVIFLVGYVLILTTIPRLDSDQLLLIYRAGKKGWFFGDAKLECADVLDCKGGLEHDRSSKGIIADKKSKDIREC